MIPTAGIIIIGDEILSGMVQDSNSFFMLRELRQIGISVRRISVVADDVYDIAKEVREFSAAYDYIFTSGGIGPTHDDVTIEGIARAFGVGSAIDGRLRAFLEKHFGKELTPAQLRMAETPEGADVIEDKRIGLPLICFRNIYILPGIPEYLREKFSVITTLLFNKKPPLLKKVYIAEYETQIAPVLNALVRSSKRVKVGSYPAVGGKDYQVMVTLESYEEEDLHSALRSILSGIPAQKIVRVEG